MKKTWQCPKCGSDRVGYLEKPVGDGGDYGVRKVGRVPAMMGTVKSVGEMEAFVCTSCGYFEEYVKEPASIQWSELEDFRWCRPPS